MAYQNAGGLGLAADALDVYTVKLKGRLVSLAAQAYGGLLPLYDMGKLDLSVNGVSSSERFLSANITPYHIILGKNWCIRHKVILDYNSCQLWLRRQDGSIQPLCLGILPGVDASQSQDVTELEVWSFLQANAGEVHSLGVAGDFSSYGVHLRTSGRGLWGFVCLLVDFTFVTWGLQCCAV